MHIYARSVKERFDTRESAAKYDGALIGTATHRREMRCITQALSPLKSGGTVLDVPCGAGRLIPELMSQGFRVTAADSSSHMLAKARERCREAGLSLKDGDFVEADALNLPFADGQFDVALCTRLLHHFSEPATRRRALSELIRVSQRFVIVSYFSRDSWDGWYFHFRERWRREPSVDRIPISHRVFMDDIDACGLSLTRLLPTRGRLSKQTFAVVARP